ncbi:Protein N-terminal glutamine amidohydrolase [Morus notabilis]|uniref:Protein N-terminal glutamine amidohydrolase n=1 Tax=Morus notabilis TaxID=981085 RepID=W9R4Z3_9ROSA|nr:Protein N-terminal glutamine amidohydrolase [Morus notabilis]
MKDPSGNWTAEPPTYDPIIAEDGAVHNLNVYMEIPVPDVVTDSGVDGVNTVFTKKLGVVIGESQLEEFFSQIS